MLTSAVPDRTVLTCHWKQLKDTSFWSVEPSLGNSCIQSPLCLGRNWQGPSESGQLREVFITEWEGHKKRNSFGRQAKFLLPPIPGQMIPSWDDPKAAGEHKYEKAVWFVCKEMLN